MSGYSKKRERLRRRTPNLLATAIGGAGLAASVPTRLRPHVEGLGEVSMGLAAGAGAPIAGLVLARGGFAALPLAGTLVAAAAILALFFVRQAA
jgi:predicted MFS family arabinose efflux permease